jgi:hypothetical protein
MLFAGLQAFVNGLLVASDGSGPPSVVGCMLLHDQFCLWSTLGGQDTTALYRLATSALFPAVQRATQPSLGQRLTSSFRYSGVVTLYASHKHSHRQRYIRHTRYIQYIRETHERHRHATNIGSSHLELLQCSY